jgi:hypothetical protein
MANWSAYPMKQQMIELLQSLQDLRAAGAKQIAFVGPAPQWKEDLPTILYHYALREGFHLPRRLKFGLKDSAFEMDSYLQQSIQPQQLARYVSLWSALCNEEGCLTRLGDTADTMTTWNDADFTLPAAIWLAPLILNSSAL